MPIVSELVEIGQQQLSDAAQSQFGLTAAAIGDTLQVAASLAIILVFINALLQIRPQPVGDLLILVVKLLLIFQFATVWSQFNAIASAVINWPAPIGWSGFSLSALRVLALQLGWPAKRLRMAKPATGWPRELAGDTPVMSAGAWCCNGGASSR